MGASLVIIDLPILHSPSEMALTGRNQKIQTTPAQASDQSFAIGIRLWRSEGSLEDSHSHGSYTQIQFPRVNAVPIVNQKSVALFVVDGLPKLL